MLDQNQKKLEENMIGGLRDKLLIGVIGLLWIGMVVYSNFSDKFGAPKIVEPIL